jgi:hypothetical protein
VKDKESSDDLEEEKPTPKKKVGGTVFSPVVHGFLIIVYSSVLKNFLLYHYHYEGSWT